MSKLNLNELSEDELEALLAEKKEKKRQELLAKKEQYETDRNTLVVSLVAEAFDLHSEIANFKKHAMTKLSEWLDRMKEYGDGKAEQQNFQIISADGGLKVIYTKSIAKAFDERSALAEEKLKEYLTAKVKKRDKESYKLIMSLLERNHVTGELDISNINRLYKMEDEINDPLFSESMSLFRESYRETTSKNYARFFKRGENDQWTPIVLDFAAL